MSFKIVGSVPIDWGINKAIDFFKQKLYFETFILVKTDKPKVFDVESGVGETNFKVVITKNRFKLVR